MSDKPTVHSKQNTENDIAIKVEGVSKTFKLPHEKQTSLKGLFLSSFRKKKYELQQALDDVSFEVKKGEFFGIVGRNGSGKSTLLKILAGIYQPSKGHVKVNGKLVPFIELGVGFNPELTGRENVYLNGALLGFTRKQMSGMYEEIVEFAELERFMDQKLKNYSSGMQVRLAFSIAIRAKGDILLLDEVLAVGDAAFQKKCYNYFANLKTAEQTVILVSHSMESIENYCDRALLLEYGKIGYLGNSTVAADKYVNMFLKEESENQVLESQINQSKNEIKAEINVQNRGKLSNRVKAFTDLKLEIKITSPKELNRVIGGLNIRNGAGQIVFALQTEDEIGEFRLGPKDEKKIFISIDNIFTNGTYYINLRLSNRLNVNKDEDLFNKRNLAFFTVFGVKNSLAGSLVHPNHKTILDNENK